MNAPTNINLRKDQWDLIVRALVRIRLMTSGDTSTHIDALEREFLRSRCDETIADIRARLPEAGK